MCVGATVWSTFVAFTDYDPITKGRKAAVDKINEEGGLTMLTSTKRRFPNAVIRRSSVIAVDSLDSPNHREGCALVLVPEDTILIFEKPIREYQVPKPRLFPYTSEKDFYYFECSDILPGITKTAEALVGEGR